MQIFLLIYLVWISHFTVSLLFMSTNVYSYISCFLSEDKNIKEFVMFEFFHHFISLFCLLDSYIFISVLVMSHLIWVYKKNWVAQQKQKYISHISGSQKSEIMVLAYLGSDESPLLGRRWQVSPCILTWWKEGGNKLSYDSQKSTGLIHDGFLAYHFRNYLIKLA